MTQQNAALVEEATAASHSMQQQAGALAALVAVFRLEPASADRPALRAVPAASREVPVARLPVPVRRRA